MSSCSSLPLLVSSKVTSPAGTEVLSRANSYLSPSVAVMFTVVPPPPVPSSPPSPQAATSPPTASKAIAVIRTFLSVIDMFFSSLSSTLLLLCQNDRLPTLGLDDHLALHMAVVHTAHNCAGEEEGAGLIGHEVNGLHFARVDLI